MVEPLTDRHRHRLDWLGIVHAARVDDAARVRARDGRSRLRVGVAASSSARWSASAVLFVAFVVAERRATEPLIPFEPLPRAGVPRRERHRRAARHGDVRDHLVPAALRRWWCGSVGDRRRAGPHADDAGGGDRLGRRRAARAQDRLPPDVRGVVRVCSLVGTCAPDPGSASSRRSST